MKRLQQGFTLIELMIVVAIVGILAAIAIPAYQDYIARSKISEVLAAMGACKTSVTEYAQTNNAFPATLAPSGCSSTPTKYLKSLDVVAGVIKGTIDPTNIDALAVGDIVLTPDGPPITKWDCTTTAPKKFAPAQCRG
jgi:type IV pilus assembly protein PilA